MATHASVTQAVKILEGMGLDQFEIYFERGTSTSLEVRGGEVEKLTQAEDAGLAFRIVRDGRLGFSFTTSLLPDAVERAIRDAFEISRFLPREEDRKLPSFGTAIYPSVDLLDKRGLDVPLAQKIEMAHALETRIKGADKRITQLRDCEFSESRSLVHLVDSEGDHLEHESSRFSLAARLKSEENGDAQSGHAYETACFLDRLDHDRLVRDAVRSATEGLNAKVAKSGAYPAIFRNDVVTELLGFLSESFSAEAILKQQSLLKTEQLGKKLFAEKITLVDDGLYPEGVGSAPFDAEGIPCTTTTLVNEGFFANILCDSHYGAKLGRASTGAASRSLKSPPSIGVSNFYLKPGKPSFEKLVASTGEGILITGLMGLHTANPVTGDFSLGATGIMIRGGKLAEPVRGFAVAGNLLTLLKAVDEVACDLRFFGSVGAPSLRVPELSIGGEA